METQLLVKLFDRLSSDARDRVTEALLEELAGGRSRTGRPSGPASNGEAGKRRAPGRKPKAGRATEDQVLAHVQSEAGLRAEQISKALGADAKWALARLKDAKQVHTEGQRRATKYFPGSGKRGKPGRKPKAKAS